MNGNATLISPQHFVYSRHVGHGAEQTFLNREGVVKTYPVAGGLTTTTDGLNDISGSTSDLALGVLADPIPASDAVSFYEMIQAPPDWYHGRRILVFGKDEQAGLNRIDGVSIVCTGDETECPNHDETVVAHYDYDPVAGLPVDESGGEGGDSGKPSLLVIEERVMVVGVHFAIGSVEDSPLVSTYDGFLPFYADQIDAHMTPTGFALSRVVVPNTPLGDVNLDGSVDLADADRLGEAILADENGPVFELNGDSRIDGVDGVFLVEDLAGKLRGDFDFDGRVDVADLVDWAEGFGRAGRYSGGDGDFNGSVDVGDLLIWAQNFGRLPT
ncbi:MAG: hypothetical protein ACYTGQ_14915, partial [Planctomycetota bacterium]